VFDHAYGPEGATLSVQTQELSFIPVFSELSKRELKALVGLMSSVAAPEGKVLTTQGEPGREFMIIEDGTARVEIDGRTVAHLGPGDFMGELSLITGDPRTATVTATSDMIVRVLNRREFSSMLDESPRLCRKIMVAAVKRVQQIEHSKTS